MNTNSAKNPKAYVILFLHILNQLNIAYGVQNHRFYFIPEDFVFFLKHRTA